MSFPLWCTAPLSLSHSLWRPWPLLLPETPCKVQAREICPVVGPANTEPFCFYGNVLIKSYTTQIVYNQKLLVSQLFKLSVNILKFLLTQTSLGRLTSSLNWAAPPSSQSPHSILKTQRYDLANKDVTQWDIIDYKFGTSHIINIY